MNEATTVAALERLAIKQGALLGNLSRADLELVLALASLCLPAGASLTEPAVNDALKGWLAGPGAMLHIDHVELRRTLIDAGLWQRDGFGRAYRRSATGAETDLAQQLSALDAPRLVAAARTRQATERAARKARAAAATPH